MGTPATSCGRCGAPLIHDAERRRLLDVWDECRVLAVRVKGCCHQCVVTLGLLSSTMIGHAIQRPIEHEAYCRGVVESATGVCACGKLRAAPTPQAETIQGLARRLESALTAGVADDVNRSLALARVRQAVLAAEQPRTSSVTMADLRRGYEE
jgi:hypothetical protein